MHSIQIHEKHYPRFKEKYPLIYREALLGYHKFESGEYKEGDILTLTNDKGNYLATGYYGIQNKGLGWVLSYNPKEKIDLSFFKRKIYNAFEKRMGLYQNPKTNAFRVFNAEGDGIGGLTIDFYKGFYLISYYSQGIYTFKALIIEALKSVAEYDGIYEKKRFENNHESDNHDGHVTGKKADQPLVVKENGVNLAVYFNDGAMTGFFLDQREVRKRLRDTYSRGKTVLNTFSYTGAFSVFAALGGAKKTVSVDLAKRSSPKTTENFELNALDLEKHDIIVEDIFEYFKFAKKRNLSYDVVILDPPSFASSKKGTFSAERDYPELLAEAIKVTENHGVIVACNNTSTLSMDQFSKLVGKGFNIARSRFRILESHTLPKDFKTHFNYPESDYLKVLFIEVQKK